MTAEQWLQLAIGAQACQMAVLKAENEQLKTENEQLKAQLEPLTPRAPADPNH